ncbi:hypothetical protein D7030_04785 [Flavobacteriaceae bacterium AU392]|nr:hypothetical protein D1817_11260 [Flavobacteriaceae bacterium]RKM85991.1 hypothetical protein D7030_04785 [Flavobacteriaceae bacterium AU392]
MNRIIILLFCSILFSCNIQSQEIINKHYQFIGGIDKVQEVQGISAKGEINIKSFNMTFPFNLNIKGNKLRFEQEAVQQGMDLNPAIIRLVNNKGYIIIDESKINRGFDINELNDDELQIWKESEFLFPFSVPYLKKAGFNFKNPQKIEDDLIVLESQLPSTETNKLYFKNNGELVKHEFTMHHVQLGKVNILRKYISYGEHNGIKYPKEWIDYRNGTELHYSIDDINFNNNISEHIFALPSKNNEKSKLSVGIVSKVIDSYITALERYSPFKESIQKFKYELVAKSKDGEFNKFDSPNSLSRALSRSVVDISGDAHFGLKYDPELFDELKSPGLIRRDNTSYFKQLQTRIKKNNFFFTEASIKNGYYYFHFSEFAPLQFVKSYFDKLMSEAAKTKGIIIDLRNNSGGDGNFAKYMSSYFLPENTMLYTEVKKNREDKVYSVATKAKAIHKKMPVIILTNGRSVSAAEYFPYVMQNHDRAIVIGERTYGAAHASIDVPLVEGIVGFVPVSASKHIKTGTDWEGTGVVPNIQCTSDEALKVAISKMDTLIND